MLAPDRATEFGISKYSIILSNAIRKNGIQVDELYFKRGSIFSLIKLIPKLRKYDLVHLQHEYNLFGRLSAIFLVPFVLLFISIYTRGRLVVTMHTVGSRKKKLFSNYALWSFVKRNVIYVLQNFIVLIFAKAIIVHSRDQANLLINEFWGKKEKIKIFTHGIDDDVLKFDKEKSKKELKLKGNVYLIIGNITPLKGADAIINQAKKINGTVVIAGNVNPFDKTYYQGYLEGLQNYVRNNNLQTHVRFDISNITDKDKLWWVYFSASDLILLPYKEATSSGVFAQAMASGKPVVSSKKIFFEDIRKQYHCLEYAEKESDYPKIINNAINPKNLKLLEKEAKRFAEDHSITKQGREYSVFYKKLAN